ncbi:MAG: iron ABC transporter permease [Deltaproteobacteria bacterium]|nr:iron ABC transporter permease [Deltaproteobacteria bacterium]
MAKIQSETVPQTLAWPLWALGQMLKRNYLSIGIALVLVWVVAAPIIMMLLSSLREGNFITPGAFTLGNYRAVYLSHQTYPALLNTLLFASAGTIISLVVAGLLAWLVERTDMPGRDWAWTMMLLPLAMPGILRSMAWILLLSPRSGILNIWAREIIKLFGANPGEEGPLNIFTLTGMIFVEAANGSTSLFLLMVGAFRLMDPSMEEAARVSGANTLTTVRRVTVGLMMPAILAAGMYAFLGNLDNFEVPLLIGLQAGIYVLPTLIYFTAYVSPSYGLATAYSSIFILFAVLLVWIYYRVIIRRTERYASITGKGYRPRQLSIGRWRWAGLGLFIVFFFLNIGLPFFVLLWASVLPSYMVPSRAALQFLTLENFVTLINEPTIVNSTVNTVILGFITATGTMGLAYLVSWLIVRLKVRGGMMLDGLAFVPHSIPTISIALALIVFYLHPAVRWIPIYGSLWIMMLALMTRYLAFATRTSNSAMTQLHQELEEAARTSGAGHLTTLARITFPLLLPPFIGGWVWVFSHTIRSFSIPLMLATPSQQTIAVVMYHYWERKADFSLASTLGVAMLVVVGLLTYFSRRFIAQGFTKAQ